MSEGKTMRLNKVLRELNISLDRAVEYLAKNGHEIEGQQLKFLVMSIEFYKMALKKMQTKKLHLKKLAKKNVRRKKQFA